MSIARALRKRDTWFALLGTPLLVIGGLMVITEGVVSTGWWLVFLGSGMLTGACLAGPSFSEMSRRRKTILGAAGITCALALNFAIISLGGDVPA